MLCPVLCLSPHSAIFSFPFPRSSLPPSFFRSPCCPAIPPPFPSSPIAASASSPLSSLAGNARTSIAGPLHRTFIESHTRIAIVPNASSRAFNHATSSTQISPVFRVPHLLCTPPPAQRNHRVSTTALIRVGSAAASAPSKPRDAAGEAAGELGEGGHRDGESLHRVERRAEVESCIGCIGCIGCMGCIGCIGCIEGNPDANQESSGRELRRSREAVQGWWWPQVSGGCRVGGGRKLVAARLVAAKVGGPQHSLRRAVRGARCAVRGARCAVRGARRAACAHQRCPC